MIIRDLSLAKKMLRDTFATENRDCALRHAGYGKRADHVPERAGIVRRSNARN